MTVQKRLWNLPKGLWRGFLAAKEFVSEGWLLPSNRKQKQEVKRRLRGYDAMS